MDRKDAELLVAQLEHLRMQFKDHPWSLLYILNGVDHPDLSPELRTLINELAHDMQVLSKMIQPNAVIVPTPKSQTDASEPEPDTEPEDDAKPSPLEDAPRKKRRRASKTFDFILIEGINQRGKWRPIVGQEELFTLAKVADNKAKKDSIVAKLNRWKNDKGWVDWRDPTNLELTQTGRAHRQDLLTYVKAQGNEDDVKDAFKTAWQFDMTPA